MHNFHQIYTRFLIVILSISQHFIFSVECVDENPKIFVSQKSSLGDILKPVNVTADQFRINLSFKELQFNCTANYPTRWFLVPSPQRSKNGAHLSEWSIHKTRVVGNISDQSTYRFYSILTMTFTNMKDRKLHQYVACRQVFNGSVNTNLTLNSSAGFLNGSFTYGQKLVRGGLPISGTRYGRNKYCDLRLHLNISQHKVSCETTNATKKIKPAIRIECFNPDECEAEIEAEKCNRSQSELPSVDLTCTASDCQHVAPKSGAIICEAVGTEEDTAASLAQVVYFTLDEPPQMFLDKNKTEIKTSQLLRVNVTSKDLPKLHDLYRTHTLTFNCRAAMSNYSQGIQWALVNGAGEMTNLGSGKESYNAHRYTYESLKTITFNSSGTFSVICMGPVWNAYDWKSVAFSVTVKDLGTPTIIGNNNEAQVAINLKQDGSEQVLKCEGSGQPLPKITWKRNGNTVLDEGIKTVTSENNTVISSELKLDYDLEHSTDKLSQVNFTCELENAGGVKVKLFIVVIDHTGHIHISKETKIGLSVGMPLLFLLLVVIIVYYKLKTHYQNENIQRLTEDDIMEFKNGDQHSKNNALFYPYNTDYEMSRTMFHIESKILGKGQFGMVTKGKIGRAPVAIKTVKKNADIAYLKALLSELKIMCFVGKHDNIVNLIGACTEYIHKHEVYIISEFCSNGNVLNYVQNGRSVFVDHFTSGKYGSPRTSTVDYQNMSVKKLSSKDLLRWSYEIACGMEFLSRKNVIHGDLAARNILLDEDLTAKVGDFGLSKQLFDYSIYVQKLECPLPLKWMAIESLRDLEFSIQSDVWSYGITLWEIFSLGQVPYPGVQWDASSYQMLQEGYRMAKPQYASDPVFKIILKCWEPVPSDRPSFADLKNLFDEQMLNNKIRRSKKYYNE